MEDLMVVWSVDVAVAGVGAGAVVGTAVEAESKTLVALTSLMLMNLHEIREITFLKRPHTQVVAEEGVEVEVRVEALAQTDLRKNKVEGVLLLSGCCCCHRRTQILESFAWRQLLQTLRRRKQLLLVSYVGAK
jgi:aspartate/tyrosine/aromatic aminotransferase